MFILTVFFKTLLLLAFLSCSKFNMSDVISRNSDDRNDEESEIVLNTTPWLTQLGAITKLPTGDNQQLDVCLDIALDSAGNVYCTGYTLGALGEANAGGYDAFILKMSHDGDLVWIRQLGAETFPGGNASGNEYCWEVVVDSAGNVYCGGQTTGPLGENYGGGSTDAFIVKLNSLGEVIWLKHFGASTAVPGGSTSGQDSCEGVAVDANGNVFCAGSTSSSLGESFGGGANDAFVVKLNSSGELVWLKQLGAVTSVPGGSTAGAQWCLSVSLDQSGNIFCGGQTNGTLGESFGGGTYDAFVLKLDPNGNLVWLKQVGGATTVPGGSVAGTEWCYDIAVDPNGNAFCVGQTNGSLGEAAGGSADAYVLKVSSAGELMWIRQLGSVSIVSPRSAASSDGCRGVTLDSLGNIYCTGSTLGSLGDQNAGAEDTFVVKLNSSGELVWIKQFGAETFPGGNTSQRDICFDVGVDAIGNVYCGGYTNGSLGEANGGTGASPSDVFIMKFNPDS